MSTVAMSTGAMSTVVMSGQVAHAPDADVAR